jgi:hypothetical protein
LDKRSKQKLRPPGAEPKSQGTDRGVRTAAIKADLLPNLAGWRGRYSQLLLAGLTLLCLLPFSGRAFHVDDTLFVWAAQQIAKHPLDPYGFRLIWDKYDLPMAEITQNPPLVSYYEALIGCTAGWSERALHLGSLLAPLALVLGTYRLARGLTGMPLLAALATLLTPAVLVSASSVMCDTMMVALWVWAAVFWIEGIEAPRPLFLMAAGLLVSAAVLAKYFGMALVPLLLVYGLAKTRRVGNWALYMMIPIVALAGYEFWTAQLYGHGLLSRAAEFARFQREYAKEPLLATALVGASFTGGCALPALLFAPFLWSRRWIAGGAMVSGFAAAAVARGEIQLGLQMGGDTALAVRHQHWVLLAVQLTLCIAGGLSALALVVTDYWERRDADSIFLGLWVAGTFIFASFLNYTVNVRSVLPLVPAVGILLARRCERRSSVHPKKMLYGFAGALLLSAVVSLCVAQGDAALANSARRAADVLKQRTQDQNAKLWFSGHWGFQYYMQTLGAGALDYDASEVGPGDFIALPQNNVVELRGIPRQLIASSESIALPLHSWASTICAGLGAGFYSSYWGPLPYVFGPIPPEHYVLLRMVQQ